MITYEEALTIVRKKHPNDLIRTCFIYSHKYIFSISYGKKYYKDDPSAFFVSISDSNGQYEVYDFWEEMLTNDDENFDKALKNTRAIDIPAGDLE